ncbi:MAG: STAS/SEC14 domain-containing protein [Planctomycetaceae bacterium]
MITIRPVRHTNIVRINSDGAWSYTDLPPVLNELRALIDQHGQICVLETISKPGADYVALVWDAIATSFEQVSRVARVAVIGDEARIDVFSELFRDEPETEIRCFPAFQYDQGVAWLYSAASDVPSYDVNPVDLFDSLGAALT